MTESDKAFLVTDDSSTMRRIVRTALKRCGYANTKEAADGAEALASAKAEHFDCILTDWNMPNMDGLQLITSLRAMPEYESVPIIMITTEGAKDDVIEALVNGASSYIVNPFTPEVLKAKLDDLFNS